MELVVASDLSRFIDGFICGGRFDMKVASYRMWGATEKLHCAASSARIGGFRIGLSPLL